MKHFKFTLLAAASLGAVCGSAPANAQADTQFIAQVAPFGFNFCPRGWAFANGQLYSIAQYQALFSLLGNTYGGDGATTFAVPDLVGRRPIGAGTSPSGIGTYPSGGKSGTTQFTLTIANLPSHTHTGTVAASPVNADTNQPVRNSIAASVGTNAYGTGDPPANNMHPSLVRTFDTGGGQPVNKVSPYTTVNWCIAMEGIFPSRN